MINNITHFAGNVNRIYLIFFDFIFPYKSQGGKSGEFICFCTKNLSSKKISERLFVNFYEDRF